MYVGLYALLSQNHINILASSAPFCTSSSKKSEKLSPGIWSSLDKTQLTALTLCVCFPVKIKLKLDCFINIFYKRTRPLQSCSSLSFSPWSFNKRKIIFNKLSSIKRKYLSQNEIKPSLEMHHIIIKVLMRSKHKNGAGILWILKANTLGKAKINWT